MKKQAVVSEIGIFGQIQQAICGGLDADYVPQYSPIEKGERVIGVIKDPMVRSLLCLADGFHDYAQETHGAHEELHRTGKIHSDKECIANAEKIQKIGAATEVVRGLLWEGIHYSFPQSAAFNGSIRAGWQLVATKQEDPIDHVVFQDRAHASNTMFADVCNALKMTDEKNLPVLDLELQEIDQKNEEGRIGQITSVPLKALHTLEVSLRNAALKDVHELRKDISCVDSKKKMREVLEKVSCMKEQLDIVHQLFWLGVKEHIPAANSGSVGLRKDWTVVRVPKSDDPLESLFGNGVLVGIAIPM